MTISDKVYFKTGSISQDDRILHNGKITSSLGTHYNLKSTYTYENVNIRESKPDSSWDGNGQLQITDGVFNYSPSVIDRNRKK